VIATGFGLGVVKIHSSHLDLSNDIFYVPNGNRIQSYALGKLMFQLLPSGATNLLVFHLLGLGFWILFMLKIPLDPHCKHHILANEHIHHISSQR
jgi:hypothetical protein